MLTYILKTQVKVLKIEITPFVPIYKPFLSFLYFLRKIGSIINMSILCINNTKLFFVYMCIKF